MRAEPNEGVRTQITSRRVVLGKWVLKLLTFGRNLGETRRALARSEWMFPKKLPVLEERLSADD